MFSGKQGPYPTFQVLQVNMHSFDNVKGNTLAYSTNEGKKSSEAGITKLFTAIITSVP
jgi:hypothetical protein